MIYFSPHTSYRADRESSINKLKYLRYLNLIMVHRMGWNLNLSGPCFRVSILLHSRLTNVPSISILPPFPISFSMTCRFFSVFLPSPLLLSFAVPIPKCFPTHRLHQFSSLLSLPPPSSEANSSSISGMLDDAILNSCMSSRSKAARNGCIRQRIDYISSAAKFWCQLNRESMI